MKRRKQLISTDQAVVAKRQHKKPCGDCPWARASLKGWLGGVNVTTWLAEVGGDDPIQCHTRTGSQCAGAAIYRANTCKRPRNPDCLSTPADRTAVFATPMEFADHHEIDYPDTDEEGDE